MSNEHTAATKIQKAFLEHRLKLQLRPRDLFYGDDILQGKRISTGRFAGWIYWDMKWRAPGYKGPRSEPGQAGNIYANDEWDYFHDMEAKEEFEDWLFDSGYRPSCDEEVNAVQEMVDKMIQNGNPYYERHIKSISTPPGKIL